jgi:hypothetical protein
MISLLIQLKSEWFENGKKSHLEIVAGTTPRLNNNTFPGFPFKL